MAVPSGVAGKSTLNPNAPLFIPMAFQQVEDFSPEWWELVKTTTWFREHWFHQHQDQETFDADDDEVDVTNLLPDSFDLGSVDELSNPEAELDYAALYLEFGDQISKALEKETTICFDGNTTISNHAYDEEPEVSLKHPKKGTRPILEPAKYWEKPAQQRLSPKCSPRRIIQQPR
ncbi:hypothetical protein GW17_00044531 [Ensete ventricosum]|nr:hypothetical protein GW17_00044531 [Ensete ventricosum]RZS01421.1 hypothetical protein BHM03_00031273 [Ensete ventricosum]